MRGIEAKLGSVLAGGGELHWSVSIDEDGRIWVDLLASSSDGRARAVLLRLRPESLANLRAKIDEAEATVAKFRALMGR